MKILICDRQRMLAEALASALDHKSNGSSEKHAKYMRDKVVPAMAAGCSVVLKPAPQTPLTALKLAVEIQARGWPAGALNVLPMSNDVAAKLVSDDRLKMLSFTGSAAVGRSLRAAARVSSLPTASAL